MVATVLCVGMAGSGKTTFMQRLCCELHARKQPPYVLNLDPAVIEVPFPANIDIRDSVNYNKVMEEYRLGPNGAIVTSLNLFATKIDQVISLIEKRAESVGHVLVDTPGQIECFLWSASGQIITDSLAATFPTMIAYIVDTPRSSSPTTFMSNMLYACSLLYKAKLPMIVVFNKTDVQDAAFAKEWMTDFEAFQNALNEDEEESESGYMGSLMTSMSLMLEEFYNSLDICAVSSLTGSGFDEFLDLVDAKVNEYNTDYTAEMERLKKLKHERMASQKVQSMASLLKDLGLQKHDPLDPTMNEAETYGAGEVISDLESEAGNDKDDEGYDDDDEDDDNKCNNKAQHSSDSKSRSTRSLEERYQEALNK